MLELRFNTKRKYMIIVIIVIILIYIIILFSTYLFYNQLKEPVYCCGGDSQTIIDDMSITYYYDIKTEGGLIKTEKPVTFILYKFGIYFNMSLMDAEYLSSNITRRMCVDGARDIERDRYEPCVDINLKKTHEVISGEDSKYVNYEFISSDGFEWKRKFIVPRKESISFAGKNVEYIDVIPKQQSDISMFFPFVIIFMTILSFMFNMFMKYVEIQQEE